VGDRVMLEVGRRLLLHRRTGEIVVRFGGDVFAFLIARSQRQLLHDDAERIRRAIGDAPFMVDGHPIALTASAGLAFVEPGQLPTAVFRNADHAAYEAKNLGRNVLVDFVRSPHSKANEDELTGLPNRWYFRPKLAGEIERSVHDGTPLTIALIDLDEFGKFNRTYGMPTADAVLKRFAAIATGCIRPADSLCRVGGDEFCLVMPGTAPATGGEIAERIRAAVASAQVHSFDGRPLSISVSIGVVQFAADCVSPDGLMQKASEAEQAAKRGGGNCVFVAPGS
jgi:diguanylate cyclase (GGDEF)-like protein